MEKEVFQSQISGRFLQIRESLYGGNNRKMASDMGVNENILSGMCCGSRIIGLTDILRLLESIPEVDANWLLLGRRHTPRPYDFNEDDLLSIVASESPEPYGLPKDTPQAVRLLIQKQQDTINHLSSTVDKLSSNK